MKKIILLILLPFNIFAQQQIKTKATLNEVTVYNNGAQLLHTGSVNIPLGSTEVLINNISGRLDENSIQVGISKGVTILAVQFNRDFLNSDSTSPEIKKLNDSINLVSADLIKTKNAKTVEEQTLLLLDENRKSGGTATGTNVAELMKLAAYYRSKNAEVRNAIASLTLIETTQARRLAALQRQLAEVRNNPNQKLGQLVIQVMAKENTLAKYNVSYVTLNANWVASYDVKATSTSTPLNLAYKAAITQNTGLDWKKVKLSLSSGNPNFNINAPVLNPWFISLYNPQIAFRAGASAVRRESRLEEVSAVGDGKAVSENRVPGVSTVNDYTTINETQLGVNFDIDIPYDVNSDNKPHMVTFKEYDVPALFKYYAAPRISTDAYLIADVVKWEKFNLQPGAANIIFEGTYTGKSYINPATTKDTLSLSMGKDKRIIVSKEKQEDFSTTSFFGSNKKQIFTYLIKIRNTKKESISINLKDQYPISKDSDIEVELIESTNANVNKETGILIWDLNIAPSETKIIKLSYSVKSPKNKNVTGL